jgi:hypothetical protein
MPCKGQSAWPVYHRNRVPSRWKMRTPLISTLLQILSPSLTSIHCWRGARVSSVKLLLLYSERRYLLLHINYFGWCYPHFVGRVPHRPLPISTSSTSSPHSVSGSTQGSLSTIVSSSKSSSLPESSKEVDTGMGYEFSSGQAEEQTTEDHVASEFF